MNLEKTLMEIREKHNFPEEEFRFYSLEDASGKYRASEKPDTIPAKFLVVGDERPKRKSKKILYGLFSLERDKLVLPCIYEEIRVAYPGSLRLVLYQGARVGVYNLRTGEKLTPI